ncbi:MAG: hypothetical protein ABJM11_13290 [Marinobacter sp.]|uniref:hypothetical protein n=1 Tax=Marinobacter sp. TaxID=50741 RepID=UPI00329A36E0
MKYELEMYHTGAMQLNDIMSFGTVRNQVNLAPDFVNRSDHLCVFSWAFAA